jgi:hypothetical protein
MSRYPSNDLKKVTSGHEIWVGEIKKLLLDFLGNGER